MHTPAPLEGEADHGAPYIPTPEEISEKCERIRRGWSSNNEQSRTVQQRPDAVDMDDLHLIPIRKPLGRKAYGSIGHLPNSRLGSGDHCVPDGQARICTERVRDKHDRVIVQEKLDGSCTAVALLDGVIHPLGRAGWPAESSPYYQHKLFAVWVRMNEDRFRRILREGERLIGEWMAQAHGTLYDLRDHETWGVFDLMTGTSRATFNELQQRVGDTFAMPHTLHDGRHVTVVDAMTIHESRRWPCEETEGVVYRVERRGKVDFLAKWVKPDKIDGRYLESVTGNPPVWNWKGALED